MRSHEGASPESKPENPPARSRTMSRTARPPAMQGVVVEHTALQRTGRLAQGLGHPADGVHQPVDQHLVEQGEHVRKTHSGR